MIIKKPLCLTMLCCLLLLVTLILPACKSAAVKAETLSSNEKLEKLLVLRFKNINEFCGKDNNVRCRLCGSIFLTGDVGEDADVMLASNLFSMLEKHTDYKIIHSDKDEFPADDFKACFEDANAVIDRIAEIGKSAGADAVFLGQIYRFKQRIGTNYGVDSPASVAFDLHLISVSGRRIIWSGHVDETQRPLSENLFEIGAFIKRGGKWVVAEDLAIPALEDILHIFFTK